MKYTPDEIEKVLTLVRQTAGAMTDTAFRYAVKRVITEALVGLLEAAFWTAVGFVVRVGVQTGGQQAVAWGGWNLVGNIVLFGFLLYAIGEAIDCVKNLIAPEWVAIQGMFGLVQGNSAEE